MEFCFGWVLVFGDDFAEHCAVGSEALGEGSGVDAGDCWDFVFFEPVAE